MAGTAQRIARRVVRVLDLGATGIKVPSDVQLVGPKTARTGSYHGVICHVDKAHPEHLFYLGDHYVNLCITSGPIKPLLLSSKIPITTTMPREFPGTATLDTFFEKAYTFAQLPPSPSAPFFERSRSIDCLLAPKPDWRIGTVRQSYTQTKNSEGIQTFLDLLRDTGIFLRSGYVAETAETFKDNFKALTGLPFTPENFRQHLLNELQASGSCFFYYDGNTMSRFFDAGVIAALQARGLAIQVFVVTDRYDTGVPPVFYTMKNLTVIEGFEEADGHARTALCEELSYLKTCETVLSR